MKNTLSVSWSTPHLPPEKGWERTPVASYKVSLNTATALSSVEGMIKTGVGRVTTARRFWPWAVYMIEKQGLQDAVGYGRPFLLYARSGDPAHAAGVADGFWKALYRKGKSDFDPWPDIDAEVTVERIDDADYTKLMHEALAPKRVDKFRYGGHRSDPWMWHTMEEDMSIRILEHLKQRGPTFGGVIFQDPHPSLGGIGVEKEADLNIGDLQDYV